MLYRFIPTAGTIRREDVLAKVAASLSLSVKKAHSNVNRMIVDKKRARRLELDSSWENVWRH
jgi:hypothetical protein